MNVGRFAVTRPVAVTMRIAALVLLGYICFLRLPVDLLPRVDIPTVAVNVNWPNTAPEEMESQITRPIEQAVSSVKGLLQVSSSSAQGSANVRVQFNYGTNIDQAAIDVNQAIQRAKGRFPNDPTISEPQVFKFDPSSLPIMVYGLQSKDGDLVRLRARMNNEIGPIIEAAGGVASVTVAGGQDRAIMVEVDPDKLRGYGIGLAQISRRLEAENLSSPAGIAQSGNTQYNIRSVGYFKSVEEIRRLPFGTFNGNQVTLGEVSQVRDASPDVLSYSRMEGKPALSVSVTRQRDSNTVETARNVEKSIAEIQARNPDLRFVPLYSQSGFIERSIHDLQETGVIGGVLAILIILFFLRNVRSTLVIALSIPISVVSAFTLFYFAGFTLNTISLSGLALAIGLIVDDAIVVLENIFRHIERDKKRAAEASVSGTQEILSAVIASTFTVMIVFLPLFLIQGQSGQIFGQFALVVVFSLAVSLLDATTVVPMLCSRFIPERMVIEEAHPELRTTPPGPLTRAFDAMGRVQRRWETSYRGSLTWSIRHRWAVLGTSMLACLAAVWLWGSVGKENIPQTDSGNLNVRIRMPVGSAINVTDSVAKKVDAILEKDPDVAAFITGVGTNVGLRGGGGGGGGDASMTVRLKENRKTSTADVVKRLQRQFGSIAGARVQVQPVDLVANILGGNNTSFSVDVYGQDLPTLTAAAQAVQEAMTGVKGLENVDLNTQDSLPEIQWKIDRQRAQSLGVSFADVASTLNAATSGRLSSYYQEAGFQYPIYVQVPRNLRETPEALAQLPVEGSAARGTPVLLGQVADYEIGTGPNQIGRQNRQRFISVGGRIADRSESEIQTDVARVLTGVKLPEGSYWQFGFQQQQREKEFSGLWLAVFLAVALIYMLLASQFESFIYPLVVLASVPLCAIGFVLALFLTDRAFGLTAFIGLLMLIGIVVKNGILLVEYTNQLRERGMSRDEAILTAGPTRLRPILMTSLSAMLGMLPLAIGIGSGSELYVPLATGVIGGLLTSTFLTLLVVPAVYTVFDDLGRKLGGGTRDLARATMVEPTVPGVEPVGTDR